MRHSVGPNVKHEKSKSETISTLNTGNTFGMLIACSEEIILAAVFTVC